MNVTFRKMLHEVCLDTVWPLLEGGPHPRFGTQWQLESSCYSLHVPEADILAYYRKTFLPAVAVLPLRWKLAVHRQYQDPAGRYGVRLLARVVPRRQSKEVYRTLAVIGVTEVQDQLLPAPYSL